MGETARSLLPVPIAHQRCLRRSDDEAVHPVLLQDCSLPRLSGGLENTKTHLEKALSRLKEDGHIDSWSEEEYREAMAKRPAHHWDDIWLDYELEITAAPLLGDLAEEAIEGLRQKRPPEEPG